MATAILRSHDLFRERYGPRSSHSANPNPNPRINNASRCRRRKRGSLDSGRRSSRDNMSSSSLGQAKGLVMGQVKILKRGEEFKPRMFFAVDDDDLALDLGSTHRLGPDPKVVQKQIRVPDLYAGPTSLVSSPPPSDLPFPSALVRSRAMESDLRKLLKI